MNEQLIKFIELCLMDGVVTDKEREVIFRKSKELGVPDDECEIILEGMIQQKGEVFEGKNEDSRQVQENKFELKKPKIIEKKIIISQSESLNNNINNLKLELNRLSKEEKKFDEDWKPYEKQLKEMGSCKPSISFRQTLDSLKKRKESLKKSKEENLTKISNSQKSIFLEKILIKLPNQCYGSIVIYNKLNQKSNLFDNFQFNKITRLLTHIEKNEKRYFDLYDESISKYLDNPNDRCFNLLINLLDKISTHYSMLNVIIENVDKDKVLFNKYYNFIEDEGIFLTEPEKKSLQTLDLIVNELNSINTTINIGFSSLQKELSGINNTLKMGFDTIQNTFESLSESNEKYLKGIESNISLLDVSLDVMSDSFNKVYFNI